MLPSTGMRRTDASGPDSHKCATCTMLWPHLPQRKWTIRVRTSAAVGTETELIHTRLLDGYGTELKINFQNLVTKCYQIQGKGNFPGNKISVKRGILEFAFKDNGIGIEETNYEKILTSSSAPAINNGSRFRDWTPPADFMRQVERNHAQAPSCLGSTCPFLRAAGRKIKMHLTDWMMMNQMQIHYNQLSRWSGCAEHVEGVAKCAKRASGIFNHKRALRGCRKLFPCPDLIFLDINMPALDGGWQFVRKYKELKSKYRCATRY